MVTPMGGPRGPGMVGKSARATRSRDRPTKDRIISSANAKSRDATATATDVPALTRPTYAIATCRFS